MRVVDEGRDSVTHADKWDDRRNIARSVCGEGGERVLGRESDSRARGIAGTCLQGEEFTAEDNSPEHLANLRRLLRARRSLQRLRVLDECPWRVTVKDELSGT